MKLRSPLCYRGKNREQNVGKTWAKIVVANFFAAVIMRSYGISVIFVSLNGKT